MIARRRAAWRQALLLLTIAGCVTTSLGDKYRHGTGGYERDAILASDTYRNDCADDDKKACAALAEMLFVGEGVFRDRAEALKLWDKACDLGDPKACERTDLTQCFHSADAPPETPQSMGTTGRLPSEAISAVIQKAMPCFLLCYEVALDSQPGLRGQITTRFMISPTGRVASAEVKQNTIKAESVGKCVVEVTNGLTFPQPKGGGPVQVTYPFSFNAQ